ncbi:hypothetical protein FD755_009459, partial [Muntiacus reevesi]
YESDDDFYDMLDLPEYVRRHHWWNLVFDHSSGSVVENYSVATQTVMDEKVGKLAATAVGVAVQITWKGVEKDINKHLKSTTEEATELVKQNLVISSGFMGGFLLGLES